VSAACARAFCTRRSHPEMSVQRLSVLSRLDLRSRLPAGGTSVLPGAAPVRVITGLAAEAARLIRANGCVGVIARVR
jgi:hypothetical protein